MDRNDKKRMHSRSRSPDRHDVSFVFFLDLNLVTITFKLTLSIYILLFLYRFVNEINHPNQIVTMIECAHVLLLLSETENETETATARGEGTRTRTEIAIEIATETEGQKGTETEKEIATEKNEITWIGMASAAIAPKEAEAEVHQSQLVVSLPRLVAVVAAAVRVN
jgi:hypothetical protein